MGSSFSHSTTRNSPCCNISFFKLHFWRSEYSSLMTPQSTGWKMMEQCVFIHLTDGNLTTQLPGCVNEGSIQYPPPSKRKLETLFTMDPNGMMIELLLPPPGRFVYFTGSRASNDPPPGLWNLMPMPVGQIGNSVPMSRRLNRKSPCKARGLLTPGPTSSFLDKFANAYWFGAWSWT